jgi:hypothetical protein
MKKITRINIITVTRSKKIRNTIQCSGVEFLKYLKFADLGVEGKGVEEHGADEGDVSGLAAHMYK